MIQVAWQPPEALQKLLADKSLYMRDKVELVIAFYSHDHGGNSPSMAEVATVLGVSKQSVERRMLELMAEGRALRVDGKLMLIASNYSHPSIAGFLKS